MSTTYFDNLEFYEDVNLIEVDGVELTDVTSDSYTFTTAGNHQVGFSFAYGNIPERMFENVDDIITAYIHEDVYVIKSYAFANSSLQYAYLPSTLAYIDSYAFYDTNISYLEMTSYTPPTLGDNVFNTSPTVISVPVAYTDDYRDAEGWNEYPTYINPEVPIVYPDIIATINITDISNETQIISDSVTTAHFNTINKLVIDNVVQNPISRTHQFNTTGLHTIKIFLTNDAVPTSLFYNLSNYTHVELSDKITKIGGNSLRNLPQLTYIDIPPYTTLIDISAFQQDNGLTTITLPSTINQIKAQAFKAMNLHTAYCYATIIPTLNSNAFNGGVKIYVPYAYVNDYKATSGWSDHANNIYPIERELTDSELGWSASSATTQSIGSYVGPTLINSYNLPVTYASSNQSIATINSSGQVTTLAYGSTTISATFAGDSSYQPKTVNYSLTVENAQPQPQSSYYVEYQIIVGDNNPTATGNYLEPSAFYEVDPETGEPVVDENTGNYVFDINTFNSMISGIYVNNTQIIVEDEEDLYYEYESGPGQIGDVIYTVRIVLPTATVPGTPFTSLQYVGDITVSQGITTIGGAFQNIYDSAGWTCHLPSTITTIENYSFYDNYTLKSITIDATTPPTITGYDPEMGDLNLWNQGVLIYVPAASEATYRNGDPWADYSYYYNIYWDIEYSMYIDSEQWSEGDEIEIFSSMAQQERWNPELGEYEYGYYWLKLARISNNMTPDYALDITEDLETNQYTLTQDDIDSGSINVKICLVNPTSTPDYLFNELSGQYDITVNNRVSAIGTSSFGSSAATSIYLPSTITSFGDWSFSSNSLDSLTILSTTPPTFGQDVFDYTSVSAIYVPAGSVQQYISAFTTAGYTDLASVVEADPNEDPEEYNQIDND